MRTFGENLRKERIMRGMTQQQLANKLGLKQQQISEWERDKVEPTLYSLLAIMDALNSDFEDLTEGIKR